MTEDVNQTQADSENLLQDIFGSDDDNDFINSDTVDPKSKTRRSYVDDDDDWSDSDDETALKSKSKSKSRLQKIKSANTTSAVPTVADIFGSDDEDDFAVVSKPIRKRKGDKKLKLKKKSKPSSGEIEGNGKLNEIDSGDEYDSGDEIVRNKDDDAFIDDDDDQKDLVAEYNDDNQDFNDKRPTKSGSNKSKSSSKKTSTINISDKSNDPLSQTIMSLKKQKEILPSSAEKEAFVNELKKKMSSAVLSDTGASSRGEPATAKLKLLDAVKSAVNLRILHDTMLESGILNQLKEWIEPKGQVLPSLEVRSAIYELLMILPCEADHLKQSGIGVTIMSLLKHPSEIIPNKKILKNMIEKWTRPIFGKSIDPRQVHSLSNNIELRAAATMQNFAVSNVTTTNVAVAMPFKKSVDADPKQRVRTPYSNGFIFTVRPDEKAFEKRDFNRERLGESRLNLLKLTNTRKGASKDNFRAIQVDGSGRDKS